MKIEVGKTYELNNGEVHKCDMMNGDDPLAVDTYGFGPFVIAGILYHQDGMFGRRDDCQSIFGIKREVITSDTRDPELTSAYGDGNHPLTPMVPETRTLAELNVKAGDVVEYISNGTVNTVNEASVLGEDSCYEGQVRADLSEYGWGIFDQEQFRIISRTSDTPKTWGELSDEDKGPIALAFVQGKAIEDMTSNGEWVDMDGPRFHDTRKYRIRPEPKRETVAKFGYFAGSEWVFGSGPPSIYDTHSITFTTTDGEPDLDSIKMEALG